MTTPTKFRFAEVSCSQCGRSFGPGDHGFSHCKDHSPGTLQAEAEARKIPPRDRFVAVGPKVIRDNKLIAGAVSNSFARRIANALNVYKPDRRGH